MDEQMREYELDRLADDLRRCFQYGPKMDLDPATHLELLEELFPGEVSDTHPGQQIDDAAWRDWLAGQGCVASKESVLTLTRVR